MTVTLTRVTISGADDGVDPGAMRLLSEEFPFVEWGILFSKSRAGGSRYPSAQWVNQLVSDMGGMKLSAHLCGKYARLVCAADPGALKLNGRYFSRVQLNGFDPAYTTEAFFKKARSYDFEVILQAANERALYGCTWAASMIDRCSVLYDPSGGEGKSLLDAGLPRHVEPWLSIGFAGGLGPDNAVQAALALDQAGYRTGDRAETWLDMESNVRTDDALDLAKVWRVLTSLERWVRA